MITIWFSSWISGRIVSLQRDIQKVLSNRNRIRISETLLSICRGQGRSQTFWFGEATGGASFAKRGAVNGLCLIALNNFNAVAWRHAENFGGDTWGARQNFGGAVAPLAPPRSAPGRGFKLLEKVAHCIIIHLLSSEASFQASVPWFRVCLWCNLCTVV